MLRWFLRRQIAAFERKWNYDASYMRELIDIDPWAMLVFGKLQALGRYRGGAPVNAYTAAGLVAVMAEDCGPCTQLGIIMAEKEGVDPKVLRTIVTRDFAAMPPEAVLATALQRRPCGTRRKPTSCAKRSCGTSEDERWSLSLSPSSQAGCIRRSNMHSVMAGPARVWRSAAKQFL